MKPFRRNLATAVALTLAGFKLTAHASTLYWDADGNAANNNVFTGAGLGSAGTWNASGPLWWTGLGSPDLPWNNSASDIAYFLGTAGTVTLGDEITVGGLTFATTGSRSRAAGTP